MRITYRLIPLSLILAALLPGPPLRAAALEEDLTACTLPHGKVLLPLIDAKEAAAGYLFRFSDATFAKLPQQPGTPIMQLLDHVRANKTADIQYLDQAGGTLWSISGKINDLGRAYLGDAAAAKFDPPLDFPGDAKTPAGLFPGVAEGHTYLIQTLDNHFALVRILQIADDGALIQYVYQPGNSMTFDVPRGQPGPIRPGTAIALTAIPPSSAPAAPSSTPTTPAPSIILTPNTPPPSEIPTRPPTTLPKPPAPVLAPGDYVDRTHIILRSTTAPATPAIPPALPPTLAAAPSLLPGSSTPLDSPSTSAALPRPLPVPLIPLDAAVATLDHQRAELIRQRLEILAAPARSPAEIERKVRSIHDLADLHAEDAVAPLIAQIAFLDTQSSRLEFSQDAQHPCLAALKHLGKPASLAALKALSQLDLDAPGDGMDSPMYRAGLLGMVIHAVEGSDVADFMLHQEMDTQTDPKRRAVFAYLLDHPKN